MKTIKLSGVPSTIKVMEWLIDNEPTNYDTIEFTFELGGRLFCTLESDDFMKDMLEIHPKEHWYKYKGMYRTCAPMFGITRDVYGFHKNMWYSIIRGRMYFIS